MADKYVGAGPPVGGEAQVITFTPAGVNMVQASDTAEQAALLGYASSNFVNATAAFAGTSASGTIGSAGISVSIGPYLTTAAASDVTTAIPAQYTFVNSNGVSWGTNVASVTATVRTNYAGSGITTTTTAGTAVVGTNNSDGLSLGVPAFLTTAMASNRGTDFVQATAGFNGTNCSGTIASNAISVSVAAGGGDAIRGIAANGSTASTNTVNFSNSNGVSFGFGAAGNSTVMTASHNGLTTAAASDHSHGNPTLNLTNLSGTTASNSAGFTLSLSAGAAGGGATLSGSDPFNRVELMAIAGGQASLWINALELPCALQFDRFGLRITHSNATNSSGSATISVWVGVYTRNASTLSSYASTSFTVGITKSGTVGSHSLHGGIKILPIPWTTTLTAGNYWVGIVSRTTTGGANMTFGNLAVSQIASTMSGYFGSASNATAHMRLGEGRYSATTAGMPAAINLTQINGNSSAFHRKPVFCFMSNIF